MGVAKQALAPKQTAITKGLGSTSIPAGARVNAQLNISGVDDGELNIRIENAVTELDREIALKKSERTLLVPKIDAALVEVYEKIKGNGGGVGAALLIGNTCDGCRLAINAVEMERIKSLDSEEVLRCEECRRILVRI